MSDRAWFDAETVSDRARAWASTMDGDRSTAIRLAHKDSDAHVGGLQPLLREEREQELDRWMCAGGTRPIGAGERAREEAPDPVRTCFERDRDRILHSSAFRRLAGKTQVFIFPTDHQRTRLTHAIEVAQIARSIAQACRLNVALAEAIALGHDCGHGPGGHASEDALSPYVDGGYDHAVWGADVVVEPLNLCAQTIDGIRNHSWSRPAPSTPEGEVVSWADRIAYVCHDFEDAAHTGLVNPADLPEIVRERCGTTRSDQLNAFVVGIVDAAAAHGLIGMRDETADALAVFRRWNYENIYMRPASQSQSLAVTRMLQALVEHFASLPSTLPRGLDLAPSSPEAYRAAVTYVGGMTDRFACENAIVKLGWNRAELPQGIGVTR